MDCGDLARKKLWKRAETTGIDRPTLFHRVSPLSVLVTREHVFAEQVRAGRTWFWKLRFACAFVITSARKFSILARKSTYLEVFHPIVVE